MKNIKIRYSNLNEMFSAIPSNVRYVVLRNYSPILNNTFDSKLDIDILTDNANNIATIINAKKCHLSNFRARYCIKVNDYKIFIDIRELGDNYYHIGWQNSILSSRVKENYLYVPDKENYYYSLLYHMLIHKNQISDVYVKTLCSAQGYPWSRNYIRSDWTNALSSYLDNNCFPIVVPNDYSVIFNDNGMDYIKQSFFNRCIRVAWLFSTGIKKKYA